VSAANGNWEELARRNGATDADVARARADMSAAPASVRAAVNDSATRQAAEEHAARAAWHSALGTVLAMLAAGVNNAPRTTTAETRDDRGINPGWAGLLGLAGLAGLIPLLTRRDHHDRTHTPTTSGRGARA
jgi:hypothetical protein